MTTRSLKRYSLRRRRQGKCSKRQGIAAIEVVIITGGLIPALIIMLWYGMKLMAAFFSVFGTMMGSPIG